MPFEVTWEHPADARRAWRRDPAHFPGLVSPFHASLMDDLWSAGYAAAVAACGAPAVQVQVRRLGGCGYVAVAGDFAAGAGLGQTAAGLAGPWKDQDLPQIRKLLLDWRGADLKGATLPELTGHMERQLAEVRRVYSRACLVRLGMSFTLKQMSTAAAAVDAAVLDAALQPEGTAAQGLERVLWYLSRRARTQPGVWLDLITPAPRLLSAALQTSEAGQEFLGEVRSALESYQHLRDRPDVSAPTWGEEPERVLLNVQALLSREQPDPAGKGPGRTEAEAILRQHGVPDGLVAGARDALRMWDNLNFWVDSAVLAEVRRSVLAVGARLVRSGILTAPGDVFWLSVPELFQAARWSPPRPWRRVVAGRAAEKTAEGPARLGERPAGAPGLVETALLLGPELSGWVAIRSATELYA